MISVVLILFISFLSRALFRSSELTIQVSNESAITAFKVPAPQMQLPFLQKAPLIDGDLAEWKDDAYHDGMWDIYRIRQSEWYNANRNRLTDHGNEPEPALDLQSRYYMAWDETYLYLGAEVTDNINDVDDPEHQPQRWYYKDCIAWFIEAPRDTIPESFGQGDNAFSFIADVRKPAYGAW